jgi:hypothetical protein
MKIFAFFVIVGSFILVTPAHAQVSAGTNPTYGPRVMIGSDYFSKK